MKTPWYRQAAWRTSAWIVGYSCLALGLLWWRLGTLTYGASSDEIATCSALGGWEHITHNLGQSFFAVINHFTPYDCSSHHLFWLRVPASLLAFVSGALFIWVAIKWFGERTALLGGLVFILSSWFLQTGRLALPTAALLLLVPITLVIYKLCKIYAQTAWLGPVIVATSGLLITVSGGVWFIAALLITARGKTWHYFRAQKLWSQLLIVAIATLWLGLAGFSLTTHPQQWQLWLGLDDITNASQVLRNFLHIPVWFFISGPTQPNLWLSGLAIFDVATTIIGFIGWFAIIKQAHRQLRYLLISLFVVCLLIASTHVSVSYLTPLICLFYFGVTGGIGAILRSWFTTFPRNPFARGLAYGMISLVIILIVSYNLRAYFIAWPHNRGTQSHFSVRPS